MKYALVLCIGLLIPAIAQSQMTPDQLRAFRLREIGDVIREKMHLPTGPRAGSPLKEEFAPFASEATGEVKVSTGAPESEVHAAINPTDTNNIVIGPIGLSQTSGLTLPVYSTTNFGKSWRRFVPPAKPYESNASVSGGGDPVFAFDADGKLYMAWIDSYSSGGTTDSAGFLIVNSKSGLYWISSTNGGQTWTRPVNGYIGKGLTRYTYNPSLGTLIVDTTTGFDDKEWMTADRTNSPYHNSMYVSWSHLGLVNNGIYVRRKPAGVDSMLPVARASSTNFLRIQYSDIGIDPNGGVHVIYMGSYDTLNFGIYQAYSNDGGKTFQPEVKVSDVDVSGQSADAKEDLMFGIRPPGNYPSPHLAIDTGVTGNVYVVWNGLGIETDEGHGNNIYFSRSTDNGKTWSPATLVNNDHTGNIVDHFYPSIAVNGKGQIIVTWYDRREDPDNMAGRYYMGISTDQGVTWSNSQVASQPMDFANVMDVNQNFGIGEYTQVLTTSSYAIPVWSDGRADDGNLRIYAAFVDLARSSVERISTVNKGVELLDNYPNPFASETKFGVRLEQRAHARLAITNALGVEAAALFNGSLPAGEQEFSFDGAHLANGVYYLNLETDLGVVRKAITVLH